jgi:hypothetical protein
VLVMDTVGTLGLAVPPRKRASLSADEPAESDPRSRPLTSVTCSRHGAASIARTSMLGALVGPLLLDLGPDAADLAGRIARSG